jgi:hypothetical protein
MKLCNSPASTRCMHQRHIARDQADPDDAQAGAGVVQVDNTDAVQQAYADLYQHLGDDSEGLGLLKQLMSTLTGDLAQDEPPPFSPRPGSAMDAAIRSGRRQASAYGFAQRFPGASRIRSVG